MGQHQEMGENEGPLILSIFTAEIRRLALFGNFSEIMNTETSGSKHIHSLGQNHAEYCIVFPSSLCVHLTAQTCSET